MDFNVLITSDNRSLEVWQQYGRPHSELLKEQRELDGGCSLGGPLRYANTVIFWIQCEKEVLDKRLDDRVDDMLQKGLLNELADFHQLYNQHRIAHNKEADYSKGIFQSIGFKEFHDYLVLTPADQKSERGQQLFQQGVDNLKLVTRRYARKQIKWIKNRFLMLPDRQVPPVYSLDATDVSLWDQKVRDVAFDVMDCVIQGRESGEIKPLPVTEGSRVEQKAFRCEICNKTMIGEKQWQDHVRGRVHQKLTKKPKSTKSSETTENLS